MEEAEKYINEAIRNLKAAADCVDTGRDRETVILPNSRVTYDRSKEALIVYKGSVSIQTTGILK